MANVFSANGSGKTGDATYEGGMMAKRVLLVASDLEDVRGLRWELEEDDCAVTFATTVQQARELIEAHEFDLLITAPFLSDGSGSALLRDADALGIQHFALRAAEYI